MKYTSQNNPTLAMGIIATLEKLDFLTDAFQDFLLKFSFL